MSAADYPEFHDHGGGLNVEALIATFWHRDGPHAPESVATAALAVDELTHYLARATSDRGSMPSGPDVYRLISELRSALGRLDQVLDQTAGHVAALANDPALYDDRRDGRPAAHTAEQARGALDAARTTLGPLLAALDAAHNASGHLGHDR